MTKRASPFEPNICRQFKIHLNNYENDINALKNVEELTLRKLMEGSKKLHSIVLNNETNGAPRDNLLQKCVTDYFRFNGKKLTENVRDTGVVSVEAPKCSYCESDTALVHQCSHCLEFYCSDCSFVNYESFTEGRICMSCS